MGFKDEGKGPAMVLGPLYGFLISCCTAIVSSTGSQRPLAERGCTCDGHVNPPWCAFMDECHIEAATLGWTDLLH